MWLYVRVYAVNNWLLFSILNVAHALWMVKTSSNMLNIFFRCSLKMWKIYLHIGLAGSDFLTKNFCWRLAFFVSLCLLACFFSFCCCMRAFNKKLNAWNTNQRKIVKSLIFCSFRSVFSVFHLKSTSPFISEWGKLVPNQKQAATTPCVHFLPLLTNINVLCILFTETNIIRTEPPAKEERIGKKMANTNSTIYAFVKKPAHNNNYTKLKNAKQKIKYRKKSRRNANWTQRRKELQKNFETKKKSENEKTNNKYQANLFSTPNIRAFNNNTTTIANRENKEEKKVNIENFCVRHFFNSRSIVLFEAFQFSLLFTATAWNHDNTHNDIYSFFLNWFSIGKQHCTHYFIWLFFVVQQNVSSKFFSLPYSLGLFVAVFAFSWPVQAQARIVCWFGVLVNCAQ